MKKINNKISLFTLSLYIAFLTIAIFHHHIYDLGSLPVVSDSITSENNSVKDPFLDDQANCRLVQFSHTQFSNFVHNSDLLTFLPLVKKTVVYISDQDVESLKISSNQLRAPPAS